MKIPARPTSVPTRIGVSAAGYWLAFAVGFVLLNRYCSGTDWDSLADLFLLAIAVPLGVLGLACGVWATGKRPLKILMFLTAIAIVVAAAFKGRSIYLDAQARQAAEQRETAHKRQVEALFDGTCAQYKSGSQRSNEVDYGYIVCFEKYEKLLQSGQ